MSRVPTILSSSPNMSTLSAISSSLSGSRESESASRLSTPATSIHPSSQQQDQKDLSQSSRPCPPPYSSEYAWKYHENFSSADAIAKCWWRNVDPMANFILHWQNRFHQHGDMFLTCLLYEQEQDVQREGKVLDLSVQELREAIRRLRFQHPSMALRLAKREELGLPSLQIPPFLAKHVDLQVALVYDLLETQDQIEAWLDQTIVLHDSSDRKREGYQDLSQNEFGSFVTEATQEHVAGRDRLKIHFWPPLPSKNIPGRILLEQCHSVSEGIGTLILFDELLKSIAGVKADPQIRDFAWGDEVVRLEPALVDAVANPPSSWEVSKKELRQVKKVNEDRMNGKASPPTLVDKIASKVISAALAGNASKNVIRREVLNTPLVKLCRSVAEKGEMLPLGLLPQTGKPYVGPPGHTAMLIDSLSPEQTTRLLAALKTRGQTLAPFLEACMHFATTWVRKQRGLCPQTKKARKEWDGNDNPDRSLGSFSNAISKRNTLKPEHHRYMGLCMGGFPTKIAAGKARWSGEAEDSDAARASSTDSKDRLPTITTADLEKVLDVATDLALQYREGRDNPNWIRYEKASMFETMQTEYLFLRDRAHYPSMPWLSSIGRLESVLQGNYPISGTKGLSVDAKDFRLVGRVGIRQPILHVYTYRKQTLIQISYANWLYDLPGSEGRKSYIDDTTTLEHHEERQNILRFWLQVFKSLVTSVIEQQPQPHTWKSNL